MLEHLVELNRQRVAEEQQGRIHWLRPEYQSPDAVQAQQQELEIDRGGAVVADSAPAKPAKKRAWPKKTSEQIRELRSVLNEIHSPMP